MNFENNLRKSGIMKVKAETPEIKKEAMEYFANINAKHKFEESVEKEKTESELALIGKINEKMEEFVNGYGGKFIYVRPENIHNLDPKKLTPENWKWLKNRIDINKNSAAYCLGGEHIMFLLLKGEDDFEFAKILVHEMLHFNSFQSTNFKWDDEKKTEVILSESVSGLSIEGKDEECSERAYRYFSNLNEAITEDLAKRFVKEYFANFEELKRCIRNRELHLNNKKQESIELDDIYVRTTQKRKNYWITTAGKTTTYKNEREYLNNLIESLYEKNKEKFDSKEDVFKVFTKAYFSGEILELARLLEKTFGKGFFRKIGKETGKSKDERFRPNND